MYRHRLGGYIAVGLVAWAGSTPEPHAGSIGGDTAIERMSEVLTWLTLVLVWFEMCKGMKTRVCEGLDMF